MKFHSIGDAFDIDKILENLAIMEAREKEKNKKSAEKQYKKDLENAVDILVSFRDALIEKGFSNQFAETALLEIIKKVIEKGEF